MHRLILWSAAGAAIGLAARSVNAAELIYGFDDPTINGFSLAYDLSDAGDAAVSQSTTTGVTQGTGALHIYVGASSGNYNQTDAYTNTVPADLALPGTTSLNFDLTLNTLNPDGTPAVNYVYISPIFFVEGGPYNGGGDVDKKLTPASTAAGINPHLEGSNYAGTTLTYNLQAYKDPYGATDGDGTTALYTPGQIVAAINAFSPASLSVVNTFGFEEINGPSNGLDFYIDNTTIPAAVVQTSPTWSINASGDWNTASNWGGTVPNAIDAVANMLGVITTNVTISIASGAADTVGTLNFNNSNTYMIAGGGSLTMQTSSGAATVNVLSGIQNINLQYNIASSTNFNVASGATLLISGPLNINAGLTLAPIGSGNVSYASSAITVGTNGLFVIKNSTSAASLTLQSGAQTSVSNSSSARTLLQLNSLSLAASSIVDLTNNDLIVHGGTLATITSALKSGFAGGTWSGPGIDSSAAASNLTHLTALGVAVYGSGTAITSIDGTALTAGDVIVKYTYYGDANLDGKVDGSDYSRIDNGFVTHATGWSNGDFNYDGVINGSDYTLIDNAFDRQGVSFSSLIASPSAEPTTEIAAASAVPEPASLSICGTLILGLIGRRRRTH